MALGEAGLRILSENLLPGGRQLNLMLPGKVVEACFGFCDIRNFTDATEVLRVSTRAPVILSKNNYNTCFDAQYLEKEPENIYNC